MVNLIVLIAYCVLMIVFLTMSVLALRHTLKFGYIDPKFKTLGWIFGFVAFATILATFYLLSNLFRTNQIGAPTPKTMKTDINY